MGVTQIFQDWTRAKITPMSELWLYVQDTDPSESTSYRFKYPEADSTFSIEPITVPTDIGGVRVVAWQLLVNAIFGYNDFETMQPALEAIARRKLNDVDLHLKALSGQAGGAYMWISNDGIGLLVRDYSATWKVESAEFRPRLSINCTGIYSVDAIEVTPGFFAEISGF